MIRSFPVIAVSNEDVVRIKIAWHTHDHVAQLFSPASICPDGVLVTGKGSRFVLSGSEQLHERIDVLTERVRELEEALDHAHSESKPNERHPMLSEELLQIKSTADWVNGPRRATSSKMAVNPLIAADQEDEESEDEPVGEQKGMLKIDDSGTSTYFGSTARTEVCICRDRGVIVDTDSLHIFSTSCW